MEPRHRYLTADATAPHLPETKETNKIGFTMSVCMIKNYHYFKNEIKETVRSD